MLPASDPSLEPFFHPRGVLVIGASTDPAKLGYGIARNLIGSGYAGAVHFVNPKGGRLFRRPVHPTVAGVPHPVDLAVILIPPQAVPEALRACAARGMRAAVIASGGFREAGPAGEALEEECLAVAREGRMRLIGPNCIGLIDTHLPLDTTFLPPPIAPAGEIAFVSQSGAICAAVIDWSRGQGFGFSRVVSLGNQVDVTETDVLPAVAADPHTRVIALYLESISEGRRFVQVARQITPHKPILALKVGRTAAGRQAASSHTGALAGSEAAFDAALRRAGVLRAATAEQLFAWAQALASTPIADLGLGIAEPFPRSPRSALPMPHAALRLAVLTNAGGPGVMAADAVEAQGLAMAALAQETETSLRRLLPPAASVDNPVDMLASASPEQYAAGLRLLLADEGVDAALVILPPPPMFTAGAVARELIPLIQSADKPVAVALMGHALVGEALAFLRAVKIPTYTFPETAVGALKAINDQRRMVNAQRAARSEQSSVGGEQSQKRGWPLHSPNPKSEIQIPQSAISAATQSEWLPPDALFELLAAYGIPVAEYALVSSSAAALAAARRLGYPVVLKIAAAEMAHKSDVGGVRLDLRDGAAVTAAFEELAALSGRGQPPLLLQRMVAGGQELIVGARQDAQFGPLLMAGSGGVEVEALGDVAFALAPLDETEAREMLRRTRAGRKLGGYRHIPAADETAVIQAVLRLGRLAVDFPQLTEIEINPLIALPKGAVAVDARARLAASP